MIFLDKLHEALKNLNDLKNLKSNTNYTKTLPVQWFENNCCSYNQFSLELIDKSGKKNAVIRLNKIYVTNTVTMNKLCNLSIVFDRDWYINYIDKFDKVIALNNLSDDTYRVQTSDDRSTESIDIPASSMSEEWLFQLSTLHDMPDYLDMLALHDIRQTLKGTENPLSFRLSYEDEESVQELLHELQVYLNDQK